ncbi:GntR family transcriptional regulator, partial [Falsiroseomonas sp. E2-1-a4]|uniref:GntR family transcriptional regulator n=1 Tax=Falsiroseomonas sp. E2-1-a4 TaxID=3239299 RepID=UPI003F3C016E
MGSGPSWQRPEALAAEQLNATLRTAILRLRLPPRRTGSRTRHAARSGLSRTPVREALRRLREDGLVAISPRFRPHHHRGMRPLRRGDRTRRNPGGFDGAKMSRLHRPDHGHVSDGFGRMA